MNRRAPAAATIAGKRLDQLLREAAARPRKYRNTPVELDGMRFDSKAELKRWQMLKLLERAGGIAKLDRQVAIRLVVLGTVVARMVWDFHYIEKGIEILDDYKGAPPTRDWRLKAKICRAMRPEIELRVNGTKMR